MITIIKFLLLDLDDSGIANKLLLKFENGTVLFKKDGNQQGDWRSDRGYKFIYNLDGTIHYQTKRNEFSLHPQQLILLNPQDDHKPIALNGEKFLIEMNHSFLDDVSRSLKLTNRVVLFATMIQKNPQISNWIKFILDYVLVEKEDPPSLKLF